MAGNRERYRKRSAATKAERDARKELRHAESIANRIAYVSAYRQKHKAERRGYDMYRNTRADIKAQTRERAARYYSDKCTLRFLQGLSQMAAG